MISFSVQLADRGVPYDGLRPPLGLRFGSHPDKIFWLIDGARCGKCGASPAALTTYDTNFSFLLQAYACNQHINPKDQSPA